MKKRVEAQRGQSMLGLLIVVVIVGLVAAYYFKKGGGDVSSSARTAPGTSPARHIERAERSVDKSKLVQVRQAVQTFYIQFGSYPESLQELVDKGFASKTFCLDSRGEWLKYDPATGQVE